MKTIVFVILGLFLFDQNGARASANQISLLDALREAESVSPELQSARFRELAASESITSARSGYLPSFDLAAIAVNGRPGAFSLLGVDSNFGANQRVGSGGALVMHDTLWDFGRTGSAVEAAKSRQDLRKKEEEVSKAQISLSVLQTYFYCSYLKRGIEDATFMAEQAKVISSETNKLIHSGQRSIIERYLVDAEEKEQETRIAEYSARIKNTEERLAIQMGRDMAALPECAGMQNQESEVQILEKGQMQNPFIDARNAEIQVSKQELKGAKATAMPSLIALASGGYFENHTQYDNKLNYSIGLGLSIPLFSGFRIDADIKKSDAELQASQANLRTTEQKVNESNSQYDEQIHALQVRLDYLNKENSLANEAFELARKRYFGFQGNMLDLREALRNFDRIHLAIAQAERDLLIARGARAIFNGVKVL